MELYRKVKNICYVLPKFFFFFFCIAADLDIYVFMHTCVMYSDVWKNLCPDRRFAFC